MATQTIDSNPSSNRERPSEVRQMAAENVLPKSKACPYHSGMDSRRPRRGPVYLGSIGTGILKLITGGGFGIWWLIDFIMAVAGKRKDKEGMPITKW